MSDNSANLAFMGIVVRPYSHAGLLTAFSQQGLGDVAQFTSSLCLPISIQTFATSHSLVSYLIHFEGCPQRCQYEFRSILYMIWTRAPQFEILSTLSGVSYHSSGHEPDRMQIQSCQTSMRVGCRASMLKVIVGDQRAIATSSIAECLTSQALKSGPHDT